MTSGNEQYARARAAALRRGRKPRDPQEAHGLSGDVRDAVRELMWRCAGCGCPRALHHLTDGGNRTYCTIATGEGRCGCERYGPAPPPEPEPEHEVSIAYRGDDRGELLVVDLLEAIDTAREQGRSTWITAPGRGRIARIIPAD